MQIDGGAGADVAADVGVQELGAPAANIQHPTGCTLHTPSPKMPTSVAQMCTQKEKHLTKCSAVTPSKLMPIQFLK